ncbi:MAG: iron-sulfur cluster assembly protein [Salinivirgaceae bacterium]|nr:iron-sulfur cluster assembly protein [Salinivirgaceae bacterium]
MDAKLEEAIVNELRTIYDPDIPVNIYDLGLVYNLKEKYGVLEVEMTLTSPGCPLADQIVDEVKTRLELIPQIKEVIVNLVWDPEWSQDMMSEEAKLDLGFL